MFATIREKGISTVYSKSKKIHLELSFVGK